MPWRVAGWRGRGVGSERTRDRGSRAPYQAQALMRITPIDGAVLAFLFIALSVRALRMRRDRRAFSPWLGSSGVGAWSKRRRHLPERRCIPDTERKEPFMKPLQTLVALALFAISFATGAADGLIAVKSPYSAKDTMDRLEAEVKKRGLNVFARIDHAAGAVKVGKTLRPTEVLIFGNPQGGTPFMECAQSVGIDLPLKALVWEDAASQVWLGYNDPAYLARRHGAAQCPVVPNLGKALAGITAATVAR